MKTATITADELRAELDRLNLQRNYPKGFTMPEFGEAIGRSKSIAQSKLSKLVHAGHVKFVGNKSVMRIDGRPGVQPVYALVKNRS